MRNIESLRGAKGVWTKRILVKHLSEKRSKLEIDNLVRKVEVERDRIGKLHPDKND